MCKRYQCFYHITKELTEFNEFGSYSSGELSSSFCFLYFLNKTVAEIKVTANPAKRGGIRVNELSSKTRTEVNWAMVG